MNRADLWRILFRVSLFVEIGGVLLLLALGFGGFAVALYIIPILIGLVGAALGVLPKPRSRAAIAALAVNGLCVAYYFAGPSLDSAMRERRDRAFDREQQAGQDLARTRARQRDDLAQLIQSGQVREAKEFLADHEGLPLAEGGWLTRLFCGLGKQLPDRDLLVQLRDYARLRDGDLVGAAASCSRELTRHVLDLGFGACAVTAAGSKPQMLATNLPSLALLFERGCAVDARTRDGTTALMLHRSAEITQFLLQRGARPRAVDKAGRSALFYCGADAALAPCLKLLLEAGADPSLRANDGKDRPLIAQARDCKNQRAADLLVAHGADPESRDRDGKSAVMYAIEDKARLAASLRWPGLHLDGVHGADLLREAMAREAWEQAELLLDAGANPNVAGSDGRSASRRMEEVGFSGYRTDNPKYAQLVRFAALLGLHPPGP